MWRKLLGVVIVYFDATCQLQIIYSAFVKYSSKKLECNVAVHQQFIDLKYTSDSVRREVLYNIFISFDIPMKLVRLIKMKRIGESG